MKLSKEKNIVKSSMKEKLLFKLRSNGALYFNEKKFPRKKNNHLHI